MRSPEELENVRVADMSPEELKAVCERACRNLERELQANAEEIKAVLAENYYTEEEN